ncbi:unnamed protein product [Rotaria socialis]|uniref:Major facilitator superfamily (MFS) profile domain-containing protein n=1 Tax=Rotaria socialis TaxID=392032 RepID=A0A818T4D7_9BILA|nr:unnamed protein product [Rotaria socialis]
MTKTKEGYTVNGTEAKAPLFCSFRLLLAFLAFLGFFLCYAQRNGLSVSIVCMVDPSADNLTSSDSNTDPVISRNIPESCKKHTDPNDRTESQVLFWPKTTRGTILGSFYWGYALTQIPSSVAVNILGPKRFLAILILVSSAATLLVPLVSNLHPAAVILLRIVAGAAQGGLWPTIFRFWATWAPASERTTLLSFPSSGPSMGTIVSYMMGGFFCEFSFSSAMPFILRFGWTYFFYVLGGLGILWSIFWLFLASDTPVLNKHISDNERDYIQACKAAEKIQDTRTKTPWVPMLRSQGFWCIVVSMFFCDFGLYAIWTVIPQYMDEVLLFTNKENGIYSALPQIGSFIVVMLSGGLADLIIKKKYLKRVNTRKLFHGVGTLAPAICLLLMSFLDCESRRLAVTLLFVGVALNGFMMSGGYVVNVGDFSGVHSGVVFGVCNTISSIGGFCAPYITGFITKNKTAGEWKLALMLYAASFLISAVAFSLLARGETEPWARDDVHDEKINYDVDANKELMEIKASTVVPQSQVA